MGRLPFGLLDSQEREGAVAVGPGHGAGGGRHVFCGGSHPGLPALRPPVGVEKVHQVGHAAHAGQCVREYRARVQDPEILAGVLQGLSEGLHFAKRADLDVAKVIEAISKGAAQSWQMENRWETMIDGEFDFGFAVDWMRKDLGIALDEAARNGAVLAMTELVDSYYAEVQELGGNRWDTSSLIARLEK